MTWLFGAGLPEAEECSFVKGAHGGGSDVGGVHTHVYSRRNYLELKVPVATQRQPYKESLGFSDSEIAEMR